MANLKQIKAKIKSVGNLKKITRALEVVSTVKLQKVKHQAEGLKQYLLEVLRIMSQLGQKADIFQLSEIAQTSTKIAVIVLTSERGLCGGLNTKLLRKVLQEQGAGEDKDYFVVGKKGLEFLKRAGASIVGTLPVSDKLNPKELLPLFAFFDQAIEKGTYQRVVLYFNFFRNSILQLPSSIQLFPLTFQEIKGFFTTLEIPFSEPSAAVSQKDLLIEPDLPMVRNELRRQIRNYVIMSALVQNKAGEHAARMLAMKSAKDNATAFTKQLTLRFNKERQAAITREISEIVSAKIAIEG